MTEENWKLERDLCRCCLSEGTFKNLAEPCLNQGEEEIYSDMLIESLDVNLTPVAGPLCTSTYTICEECILRLRDACSFKRQVLLSEKRFRDLYSRDVIQLHTSGLGVKEEVPDSDNEDAVKMEIEDDDFRVGYDDDVEYDDNKSDIELDLATAKKAKPKKPKAKEKPKPKKRAGRPRKAKADTGADAGPEARADADRDGAGQDEKKDSLLDAPPGEELTVLIVGAEPQHACDSCAAAYHTRKSLTRHIRTKHRGPTENKPKEEIFTVVREEGGIRYACKACDRVYKTRKTMRRHVRVKHTTNASETPVKIAKYNCDVCGERYRRRLDLAAHLRTHLPSCKICKKIVRINMERHLMKHSIYRCLVCSDEFTSKPDLEAHAEETHGGVAEAVPDTKVNFICDECGKEIRGRARDMVRHLRCHSFFICMVCSKVLPTRKRYNAHCAAKHPVPMYDCGICGYKTSKQAVLLNHQRNVHMREKDVPCPHCDAMFFSVSALNYHLVRHNPVKKFECRFCKKRFPRLETVRRHEMIHTGVKKKVCRICDARFVQKASLSYHLKKYHPEAV